MELNKCKFAIAASGGLVFTCTQPHMNTWLQWTISTSKIDSCICYRFCCVFSCIILIEISSCLTSHFPSLFFPPYWLPYWFHLSLSSPPSPPLFIQVHVFASIFICSPLLFLVSLCFLPSSLRPCAHSGNVSSVTDLMSPPHHEVGEDSNPHYGSQEGDHKEFSGFLRDKVGGIKAKHCWDINDTSADLRSMSRVFTWLRTSGTVSHRGRIMGSRKR